MSRKIIIGMLYMCCFVIAGLGALGFAGVIGQLAMDWPLFMIVPEGIFAAACLIGSISLLREINEIRMISRS